MTAPFLLSVIIPCYNCQDYIYECLQSVYSQIDDSVEIIVINDGSTDNSLKEIELFINKSKKNTIKLITQINQGVSAPETQVSTHPPGNIWHFWTEMTFGTHPSGKK
ncbi:putative glycosyl transferase [Citrobacter koseri]|nr:glycosyltransferase [Citrobacter koseri]SQB66389.1 putative glycosyl transferase [Citrobacter koseri]